MQTIQHPEVSIIENEPWKISEKLVEEESKWYNEVVDLMIELGLNVFPSCKQFTVSGKSGLYNRINNYMGRELFCEVWDIKI